MPVERIDNGSAKAQTNEFVAYALFDGLILVNFFIDSSIYSVGLFIIAILLAIKYKPVLMIVPCMLADTLQGYFMITSKLSFNRMLAMLFVISCIIHYKTIRATRFTLVPIVLGFYVLTSELWSITGAFNDGIAFLISMAMIVLMDGIKDVDRNSFYRLFNISFALYGLSLIILTFNKAGGINASQVVFDEAFNANNICLTLALSACVIYSSFLIGRGFGKIITYGYIGVCLVSILLIGSRTSLIAAVVSILLTYVLANKQKGTTIEPKTIVAFIFVIAALGAVLYIVMRNNPDIYYRFTFSSRNRLDLASVERRTEIWDALIHHIIPSHLFFGIGFGLMNVKTAVAPYVFYAKHAHNMYLAIIAETGLVGLLLFGIFFSHYIITLVKSKSDDRVVIFAVLILAFVNGIGEQMLNQRWLWLTFGLCGVLLKNDEQREVIC